MDKVQITITTDKPVKIRVASDDSAAVEEADGLNRLLDKVKGGNGHVVSKREARPSGNK